MDKPAVRCIGSDLGKVVVDFDNRKAAREFARYSLLLAPTEGTIYDILFREFRELFDAYMRGHVSTELFRKLVRSVLRLGPDCRDEDFDACFGDVFAPNEPVIERWRGLRAQGILLVAGSNLDPIRHRRLVEMGIPDLFDRLCISYLERLGKPDPAFYRRLADIARRMPKQILIIDDHEEFLAVAAGLGFQTVHYDVRRHDTGYLDAQLGRFEFSP